VAAQRQLPSRSCRYKWESIRKAWEKSFQAEGFNLEILKAEVWSDGADGLEIQIFDDTETLVAHSLIDNGKWRCLVNTFDALCASKAELSQQVSA